MGTQKNHLNKTISFKHPKHMLKLMGKKIFTILHKKNCLSKPMGTGNRRTVRQTHSDYSADPRVVQLIFNCALLSGGIYRKNKTVNYLT